MSFFDNLKKVVSSAITIIESVSVKADEMTRKNVKKMSDKELKTYADRTGSRNKYIDEEIRNRGI